MTRSVLVVHAKPVAGREQEFDEWYSTVHLPEVLRLEGFLSARRFRLAPGDPGQVAPPFEFLAIYEVATGMLDQARRVLADALASSRVAVAAGEVPQLTPSDSLHAERLVGWYQEITAAEAGPDASSAGSA